MPVWAAMSEKVGRSRDSATLAPSPALVGIRTFFDGPLILSSSFDSRAGVWSMPTKRVRVSKPVNFLIEHFLQIQSKILPRKREKDKPRYLLWPRSIPSFLS